MFLTLRRRNSKAYKHIFIDLDRTIWDFEQNKTDALHDIFFDHQLDLIFPNFDAFMKSYTKNNDYLWIKYRKNELPKEILRFKRFEMTLSDYGEANLKLAKTLGEEYLQVMPLKTATIPGSRELLEYLHPNYSLYVLSNGFSEVQTPKLKRCHLDNFFDRVITSEALGFHKPDKRAFGQALSIVNARKEDSIMIGDELDVDILGARKFGIDQIYFNPFKIKHRERVTHEVTQLLQIKDIL